MATSKAKPNTDGEDHAGDGQELANVNQAVKRKRNRPDLENFGYEKAEPGDNTRYIRAARVALDLPPIDISDEKQVYQRINQYFDYCENNDIKPGVVGLANWLGVERSTLYTWQQGTYRGSTHSNMIKRVFYMLEEMWSNYMIDGKVNPASGIFLGKNWYHYRDVTDLTIEPKQTIADIPAEDVVNKYMELPD